MILSILFLFLSALLGGGFVLFFKNQPEKRLQLLLFFSGSYLFSITILHILPELYALKESHLRVSLFVLIGFFMQKILEYFSSGVEHGHIHHPDDHHHHSGFSVLVVMLALSLHAFLEGTLLAHPSTIHPHHQDNALLLGIVLHKAPAALALMTVLTFKIRTKGKLLALLLIFSLASPLGLYFSDIAYEQNIISDTTLVLLFALVSGNFLHISTTIFVESNPQHHFSLVKLIIGILGAVLAYLSEIYLI